MPLILTTGAPTASGLDYDDVLGVRYEYPRSHYRSLMKPGTPFIYYRGGRAKQLELSGLVYFASGVVGEIEGPDEVRPIARVLDYTIFPLPVPFKQTSLSVTCSVRTSTRNFAPTEWWPFHRGTNV
jgi:hypothetical protein